MAAEPERRHDHPPLKVRVRIRYVSGDQGAAGAAQGAALRALLNALDNVGHPRPDHPARRAADPDHCGS